MTGSEIGLVCFKAFVWGGGSHPPSQPKLGLALTATGRVSLVVHFLASCLVLAVTDDFSFPQALERFLFSLEKTSSHSFSTGIL